jgi:hypothetical protein
VFSGTVMENTHSDIRNWFFAMNQMVSDKKGISTMQLQWQIGGQYRTSWRMLKQIRTAMGNEAFQEMFEAIVEIDETYIGGKPRKEKRNGEDEDNEKKSPKRGRGTNKTPVVGVKERSSGKVHAVVALPDENNHKRTGKQLLGIVQSVCKPHTTIVSDEFSGYNIN